MDQQLPYRLLHDTLERYVHFSEHDYAVINAAFTVRQVDRNHLIATAGETSREMFFVNRGLLRLYYQKEGTHITGFIFREGLFAGVYESFLTRKPGVQNLETIEPCSLLVIQRDDFERLHDELPLFNVLTRKITEERFLIAQQLLSSFLLDTPEERYRKFLDTQGDLLLRAPHHIIASFLGITPVSLSRIRRRILEGE